MNLWDIPIYADVNCVRREDIGQVRTHRRKRINKKWRKRYGVKFKMVPCAYMVSGKLLAHPDIVKELSRLEEDKRVLVAGMSP